MILISQVYKQAFWLGLMGASSPKRSILWSSSPAVWSFRYYARLTRQDKAATRSKLCAYKTTAEGKKSFSGIKKHLKNSQPHVSNEQINLCHFEVVYCLNGHIQTRSVEDHCFPQGNIPLASLPASPKCGTSSRSRLPNGATPWPRCIRRIVDLPIIKLACFQYLALS